MLRRDAGKSVSICDGYRKRNFFHKGRGCIPLLAVILLATPQLALANGLTVTITPTLLDITEGDFKSYTVKLEAAQSEKVTITVKGAPVEGSEIPGDAITVDFGEDLRELIFEAGDISTREVKVWAKLDPDAVSEEVFLTHTYRVEDSQDVSLRDSSVHVRVSDTDMKSVTLSMPSVLLDEAGTTTYEVSMGSQPTAVVTVDIGGATDEITVSPSRLFFTSVNWSTPKSVSVYAAEDFDADPDSTTLSHTARGGDYTGVPVTCCTDAAVLGSSGTVEVRVSDNDIGKVGVDVSPSALRISAGARASYTMRLKTQPSATVKISVKQLEGSEIEGASLNKTFLSFTQSNWNRPQKVTVTARSTSDIGTVNIEHKVVPPSSGGDENYNADLSITPVSLTVDGLEGGIRLSPSSLSIGEDSQKEYRVWLDDPPEGGDMTSIFLSVEPDDLGVSVSPPSVTFDSDNDRETIIVTTSRDKDAIDETVMILHKATSASGPIVPNGIVSVTVTDSDTQGVTVEPKILEITEGATGFYTVVLDTEPTDDVTVAIGGASGDVTLLDSQLTFTPSSWSTAKQVEVKVEKDEDGEVDDSITLTHMVRGADYNNLRNVDSVRVSIQEMDTKEVVIAPSDSEQKLDALSTDEGKWKEYRVKLGSQPTGIVIVAVNGDLGDLTVRPSQLVFTPSTWNRWQTVRVDAGEDADAVQDPAITLMHTPRGGGYDDVGPSRLTVTIKEGAEATPKGVTARPQALTIDEGSSGVYSLVLDTEPTGTVTIRIMAAASEPTTDLDPLSLRIRPTLLTFTRNNWDFPQTVEVEAREDDDAVDGTAQLSHETSGGGYDSVTPVRVVDVKVRENDKRGVTVTPTSLEIVEGKSETYSIVLNTEPSGAVQVTISEDPGNIVTISPSGPFSFTQLNWNRPRVIRVHVADDETENGDRNVSLSHSFGGTSDYGSPPSGVTIDIPPVSVEVKDNEKPGIAVSPTALTIREGESKSYKVVLTKVPTESVTVKVTPNRTTSEVRLSRSRLLFSTRNWNVGQTVAVTLREDDDAAREAALTLDHTVTGAPEYEDPLLEIESVNVTFEDDDTRGLTVSPTELTVAAGGSGSYQVRFNTQPTDSVTVTVNNPRINDVEVDGSVLVFTTSNWKTNQRVTVRVLEEVEGDEEQTFTLSHSLDGGDYDGGRNLYPVTVTIPIEGAPSAPRSLTAEGGDQRVTLSWSAPSNDGGSAIVRYEYRHRDVDGNWSGWTRAGGASVTSYTVRGLDNGTSYEFEVRAVNGVAPGQPATVSETLAESAPGAPAGLTATGGDERVTLSWSAPDAGGSQILRYEYRYAADGDSYNDWDRVSGGGSARSVPITDLTNGTEYRFQVRAVNAIGTGDEASASATPGRAPSAPTGLTARSESETITVMWGMPADNGGSAIIRFEVRYRMSGGRWGNWMPAAGGDSATSYPITGLTNGVGYEIAVRAVNGIDAGASDSVEATPMEGLNFAHFANGVDGPLTNISDIVLVNVDTSTVNSAIYFYSQAGEIIPADTVVDMTGDMESTGDGGVTVAIEGEGEITVSTSGEGDFVTGSVKVFSTGRVGGVLRFDISPIGVAGVGASAPVSDAIFPVRRMEKGINTGVAIRNLGSQPTEITCHLMQDGRTLGDPESGELIGDGQVAFFIDQLFGGADTSDFEGAVRCMASEGGMFAAVALEMDAGNRIFTTLPVVPVDPEAADDGASMLNFAHFANGDLGGVATSSDLVFVNVANTAVAPTIYFYDRAGDMIDADSVVDVMVDGVEVADDGALTVSTQIPRMGEMTISTNGMGEGVIGSVRVVSDGPLGGVLRFDIPTIGVAGVGASEAVNAAIFPARRMAGGINTGAAIRNMEDEAIMVTCALMQDGDMVARKDIALAANGQSSEFINETFGDAATADFEGSVHCSAPEGKMFTGVALEMDFFGGRIFTTLPVVPVR